MIDSFAWRWGGPKPASGAQTPDRTPVLPRLATLGGVTAATFLAAWVSLHFTRYDGYVSAMWLANATVAAVLLRAKFDRWGELVIAAFLANLAAHVVIGDPIAFGLARSALKVAEFLIVVIPIQRRFGTDVNLHDIRQLVFFLFYAGLVAPLASVAGLAVHDVLAVGAVDPSALGTWFMSHALGYLILTPLLLTIPDNLAPFMAPTKVNIERLMIIIVTALAAVWVYSHHAPLQWTIIPLLVLAAFRLPPCGVALTIAIVAVIATVSTSSGNGPIAAASFDATGRILLLQAFIATAGLVALSISAIIGERDRLLAEAIVARDERNVVAGLFAKLEMGGKGSRVIGPRGHAVGFFLIK